MSLGKAKSDFLTKIKIFSSQKEIFSAKTENNTNSPNDTLKFLIDVLKQMFSVEKINLLVIDFITNVLPKIESKLKKELIEKSNSFFNCNVNEPIQSNLFNGFNLLHSQLDLIGYYTVKKDDILNFNLNDFNLKLFDVFNNPTIDFNFYNALLIKSENNIIDSGNLLGDGFKIKIHPSFNNKDINSFIVHYLENIPFFKTENLLSVIFGSLFPLKNKKIEDNIKNINILNNQIFNEKIIENDYYTFNKKNKILKTQTFSFIDCDNNILNVDNDLFLKLSNSELIKTNDIKSFIQTINQNDSLLNNNFSDNTILNLFKNIVFSLSQSLFLPHFIILIKLLNFNTNRLENVVDYYKTNQRLIKKIILDVILEEIIQYLLPIIIEELKLILIRNLRLDLKEKYENYLLQLRSLIGIK